jgi:hypothetical protein
VDYCSAWRQTELIGVVLKQSQCGTHHLARRLEPSGLEGKGHKTRSLGEHAGTMIFIPVAGDSLG